MKTSINHALPEWLQTKEQQQAFLKEVDEKKPEPYERYYDVDLKAMHTYLFDSLFPYLSEHGYVLRKVRVREERKKNYMDEGRYLPEFLQDFHDQKSFFKRMAHLNDEQIVNWVKAQCYTVDLILWNAMRLHDCKIQKTLRKEKGQSLAKDIWEFEEAQMALLADARKKRMTTN